MTALAFDRTALRVDEVNVAFKPLGQISRQPVSHAAIPPAGADEDDGARGEHMFQIADGHELEPGFSRCGIIDVCVTGSARGLTARI